MFSDNSYSYSSSEIMSYLYMIFKKILTTTLRSEGYYSTNLTHKVFLELETLR